MNLSKETIERFLDGRCTPGEATIILDALREHPGLLDEYMSKDEWDEIDKANTFMPPDVQERTTKFVLKQTTSKAPGVFSMKYKWMMAAACIAGLVTAGVFFFKQQKSPGNGQNLAQAKVTRGKTKPPTDTVIVNNGKKELTIALKDGSQVLLGINAAISYQPGFTGPQREIYLKGEAYFKVAKDKNKPFVVYSHGITTTALGTSFTIRALENDQFVSVALHTGKVVIRQVIGKTDPAAAIYLLPGDRLTVNTQTFKAQIEKGKSVDSSVKNAPFKKDSILHFDREPLAKVLDKLIQQYDTTIQYDGALLSELSFTGSLRTDEPLEKILRNIALLNDLTITRTSRGYSVSTGQ